MDKLLSIFVCVGSACHLKGSNNIINRFQQIIEERQLGEKVVIKADIQLPREKGRIVRLYSRKKICDRGWDICTR